MAPIAIKPILCGKITSKIVIFTESTVILPFKLESRLVCHFKALKTVDLPELSIFREVARVIINNKSDQNYFYNL